MLYQCVACSPATERGAARAIKRRRDKKWRTIDIHCHCMVPEANALVMQATGVSRAVVSTSMRTRMSTSSRAASAASAARSIFRG